MELMHNIRRFCHGSNDIICEGCGVGRSETDSFQPFDIAAGSQEPGKSITVPHGISVGIDILPEQGYLFST